MHQIVSYGPAWLNHPSPAHKLFRGQKENGKPELSLSTQRALAAVPRSGPRRTIAKRGTECFVAANKEILWGDLVQLREIYEFKRSRPKVGSRSRTETPETSFDIYDEEADNDEGPDNVRVLKAPVASEIRQLIMSPNEDYLAVVTTHTVHICILPDSSQLHARDIPFRNPKFWTLGPTIHVTSRSPIASALWHPLGANGSCLVTVTQDAVVRLWEISPDSRYSVDAPTLDIDLKKLADGTYLDQQFGASVSATNKAFSPDSFDMEVAAACFPARSSGGWSPMTLWVAMMGGDVYALCPLLPKFWAPPPTLVPALSVSIAHKSDEIQSSPKASAEDKLLTKQQLEWMADLDNQDPTVVDSPFPGELYSEIYTRPEHPGSIPRLQGPCNLALNPDDEQDDEIELRDIYVIGEHLDIADLMYGEEDEELETDARDEEGLPCSAICLLSASGQVKICLDERGVEAQWLPPRTQTKTKLSALAPQPPSLLVVHTCDTLKPAEVTPDGWPMFSEDTASRYSFYVTHSAGISFVSMASWASRLASELEDESGAGQDVRMQVLAGGAGFERERLYTQPAGQTPLSAAVAMADPRLGTFVLSATRHDPIAIFFDMPELRPEQSLREPSAPLLETVEVPPPQPLWEPRPVFHPSEALEMPSAVPAWFEHMKTGRRRPLLQQEVRLSVATLEVLTEGHRVVSTEVHRLNNAVAELFRKCQALHLEIQEQIDKANLVRSKVDVITGNDEDDEEPVSYNDIIQSRVRAAHDKQVELAKRVEAARKRVAQMSARKLSDKEKAWAEEVRALEASVLGNGAQATPIGKGKTASQRFEEVLKLKDSILAQAEKLQKESDDSIDETGISSPRSPASTIRIPGDVRRAKVAHIKTMLDRETALVDAVMSRLERLQVG